MKRAHCGIIVIICWSGLASAGTSPQKAPASFWDTPVVNYPGNPSQEMWAFCHDLDMPCGIEMVNCEELDSTNLVLRLDKTTARNALSQMLKRHPGYHYTFRDSVFNFKPSARKHQDPLSERLPQLSIHGSSSSLAARDVIHQSGIQLAHVMSEDKASEFATISLKLKDVTVREALNAIAKADGHAAWVFCVNRDGAQARFWIVSYRRSMPSRTGGPP